MVELRSRGEGLILSSVDTSGIKTYEMAQNLRRDWSFLIILLGSVI